MEHQFSCFLYWRDGNLLGHLVVTGFLTHGHTNINILNISISCHQEKFAAHARPHRDDAIKH